MLLSAWFTVVLRIIKGPGNWVVSDKRCTIASSIRLYANWRRASYRHNSQTHTVELVMRAKRSNHFAYCVSSVTRNGG